MTNTPSIIARAQAERARKAQPGTLMSFTTVHHPPAGFPKKPRIIGLITLDDGSSVLGQLIIPHHLKPTIGQRVLPRMRLSRVNNEGLRIYDISYEVTENVREPKKHEFPGYILALTGPSGVGKSTVSALLVKMVATHVEKVPILTTRKKKKGDDGEYEYISEKRFIELQKNGEIASFTQIPSTSEKRWYGYRSTDIETIWKKGKIPVVVTEMHLLQGLAEHYGRRSILSCGLLPPGKSKRTMLSSLLHRLRTRGRDTEQSIQDRLKNAEKDLAFFKERHELFDHLIVNEDLDTVIATLKQQVLAREQA